ncbi:methylated-DNA--[protein]-cysteine S-methyltransferase [Sphingomonas sp. PAMC 26605]|uniref:methylated-DNA--[protein]-cysteine S-methyltransferase n=1 Tax=Sphingomonas sp. PAMC 26605 TaxID=1112214 RepID=UPI00026CD053|nr:methylated-DNA--[protein]-cysteine S-methyltransferase [Sphingomonas sp. PAMC 26605]
MYARDTTRIATPVGVITLTGDDDALYSITIGGQDDALAGHARSVRAAEEQLRAWFAGTLKTFDLPLSPAVSERGQVLRDAMIAIPYAETLSYGALAKRAGSSARAIGQACARNPFPIVVPCHRVLNASGSLGAYSAGDGPVTKDWLLAFERRGRRDLLL